MIDGGDMHRQPEDLSHLVRACKRLDSLDIRHWHMSSFPSASMSRSISSLRQLSLEGCVELQNVDFISDIAGSLQHLSLADSAVTANLSTALSSCTNLRHLDISFTRTRGHRAISVSPSRNSEISTQNTQEGIGFLSAMPQLRHVNLSGCAGVSSSDVPAALHLPLDANTLEVVLAKRSMLDVSVTTGRKAQFDSEASGSGVKGSSSLRELDLSHSTCPNYRSGAGDYFSFLNGIVVGMSKLNLSHAGLQNNIVD